MSNKLKKSDELDNVTWQIFDEISGDQLISETDSETVVSTNSEIARNSSEIIEKKKNNRKVLQSLASKEWSMQREITHLNGDDVVSKSIGMGKASFVSCGSAFLYEEELVMQWHNQRDVMKAKKRYLYQILQDGNIGLYDILPTDKSIFNSSCNEPLTIINFQPVAYHLLAKSQFLCGRDVYKFIYAFFGLEMRLNVTVFGPEKNEQIATIYHASQVAESNIDDSGDNLLGCDI